MGIQTELHNVTTRSVTKFCYVQIMPHQISTLPQPRTNTKNAIFMTGLQEQTSVIMTKSPSDHHAYVLKNGAVKQDI
jgi:hypothetical protein